MHEKMNDPNKLTRRAAVAGATAALAAVAIPKGAEWLGISPDPEKFRQLTDPYYATQKYMEYRGGKLRANFDKLRAIGSSMKNDGAHLGLSQDARDREIAKLTDPIVHEKNALLREFDPELVTHILIESIGQGLVPSDQPLIKIFERAGGDPENIRKGGRAGLKPADIAAIANIMSVMTYRIETNPTSNYGNVHYDQLTFIGREARRGR